jgi:hypothetical protein
MNVSGGQTSAAPIWAGRDGKKIKRKPYERELERLEAELVTTMPKTLRMAVGIRDLLIEPPASAPGARSRRGVLRGRHEGYS